MNCGQELRSASVYIELLRAPVEKLPLPKRKMEALRSVGIETVGQLITDENPVVSQSFSEESELLQLEIGV